MPSPVQEIIPPVQRDTNIQIALDETRGAIQSLMLLKKNVEFAGMAPWVSETARALTPEEFERNNVVAFGLYYAIMPPAGEWPSFSAYLDHLASIDPYALREQVFKAYTRMASAPLAPAEFEAALESADVYLAFLYRYLPADTIDEPIERAAYALMRDPAEMRRVIVAHLRRMWETYLEPEWRRVQPLLQQAVAAFRQIQWSNLSFMEALRLAAGQDIDEEKWAPILAQTRRMVIIPHPHPGPYLIKMLLPDGTLYLFVRARLPEGSTLVAPELTRAEILTGLNALADDTRLQILRFIAEKGEASAQEIIAALELSQPTASRHLSQLTAAGYLKERRRDSAKIYTPNPERLHLTLRSTRNYLLIRKRNVS